MRGAATPRSRGGIRQPRPPRRLATSRLQMRRQIAPPAVQTISRSVFRLRPERSRRTMGVASRHARKTVIAMVISREPITIVGTRKPSVVVASKMSWPSQKCVFSREFDGNIEPGGARPHPTPFGRRARHAPNAQARAHMAIGGQAVVAASAPTALRRLGMSFTTGMH
jgi:hypothetical protein